MIETALNAYLLGHTGVAAMVGTRIYPLQAPKGTATPYLVYLKVSSGRRYTHDGFANFQQPRMQISCYAERYLTSGSVVGVKNLAQEVIAAIEAWPGATYIQAAFLEDEKDLTDPDTKLFHIALDFFVDYGA